MITATTDDNVYLTYELPTSLVGTVYVRLIDSDRTAGNRSLDTVYVDHLYVESEYNVQVPTAVQTGSQTIRQSVQWLVIVTGLGVLLMVTAMKTIPDPSRQSTPPNA